MKLRQAIKICRIIHEPDLSRKRIKEHCCVNWRCETIWKARTVCRRFWRDRRVPYIPTDEELTESLGMFLSVLSEVLIEDYDEREDFQNQLWSGNSREETP